MLPQTNKHSICVFGGMFVLSNSFWNVKNSCSWKSLVNGNFLGYRVGWQFQMQGGYNFVPLKMASILWLLFTWLFFSSSSNMSQFEIHLRWKPSIAKLQGNHHIVILWVDEITFRTNCSQNFCQYKH